MSALPLTSLITIVAIFVYFWTLALVGRARSRYGVAAPAVTGNEQFERCFRVQMNTVEQLLLMLPALWLCAAWVGDQWSAAGGLVWSVGRIVYGLSYMAEPKKRSAGFGLTVTPTIVMAVAALVAIVKQLMA